MNGFRSLAAALAAVTLLAAPAALPAAARKSGPVQSAASSSLSKCAPQERAYANQPDRAGSASREKIIADGADDLVFAGDAGEEVVRRATLEERAEPPRWRRAG